MVDGPFVGSKCTVPLFSRSFCHYYSQSLPVLILSVALLSFFCLFLKHTQRMLSTHLKAWVPISFTQLKWCFDEHTNEYSPHDGPLAFTLCSGTGYLWVGSGGERKGLHHHAGQTHTSFWDMRSRPLPPRSWPILPCCPDDPAPDVCLCWTPY